MSILDSLLGVFAYLTILVPIAIFIVAAMLYYYKPMYRLVVGLLAVVFGSLGLVLYFGVLLISLVEFSSGVTFLSAILVIVEVFTLYVGVKSLRNRGVKPTTGNAIMG